MLSEFRGFLLRGNLIDLAVAVVIGAAFGALVASLVENMITPVIAAVVGEPDFSGLTFEINGAVFHYGAFLNALITFVSIAGAIFFLVVKPIGTIQKRMGIAPPEDGRSDEAVLLEEIRDAIRSGGAAGAPGSTPPRVP